MMGSKWWYCRQCEGVLVYIGATVGGKQLYACVKCGAVYAPEVVKKGGEE